MDARSGSIQEGTPLLFSTRPVKPALFMQLMVVICACMAAVCMGFVIGYSSPALLELDSNSTRNHMLTNDNQDSWFGALTMAGALCGGPLAGLLIEVIGRKGGIAATSLPSVAGWLLIVYAQPMSSSPVSKQDAQAYMSSVWLDIGRFLTGLGMGMISLCVPVYIGEIVSKEYRGVLGAFNQIGVVVGVLGVYAMAYLVHWRWLAYVSACLSALSLCLIVWMPDSPRWLLSQKYTNDAVEALHKLRGPKYDIEVELLEMEASIQTSSKHKFRISDLKKPGYYKPLVLALVTMMFQQLSGINAIITYAGDIFASTNFSSDPNFPPIILGVTQVVFTIIAAAFMDKAGRRIMLMIAGTLMTLSCATLGTFYYLQQVQNVTGIAWLSLASLSVFVIGFSLGWGPIPWILMSELFPLKIRGAASGISTLVNWTCSFIVVKEFSTLEKLVHKYGAFWVFAGINLLGVIFVFFFLPETKGKSLEEIEEYFEKQKPVSKNRSIQTHSNA